MSMSARSLAMAMATALALASIVACRTPSASELREDGAQGAAARARFEAAMGPLDGALQRNGDAEVAEAMLDKGVRESIRRMFALMKLYGPFDVTFDKMRVYFENLGAAAETFAEADRSGDKSHRQNRRTDMIGRLKQDEWISSSNPRLKQLKAFLKGFLFKGYGEERQRLSKALSEQAKKIRGTSYDTTTLDGVKTLFADTMIVTTGSLALNGLIQFKKKDTSCNVPNDAELKSPRGEIGPCRIAKCPFVEAVDAADTLRAISSKSALTPLLAKKAGEARDKLNGALQKLAERFEACTR